MFPQRNTLFYGDNLPILREHIPDAGVDLVYLDPPFNSSRNYNVLFKNERGQSSEAQVQAFVDTWSWGPAAQATLHDLITRGAPEVATVVSAFHQFLGTSPMMAYLVMMAARLVELHRVLKPTGSLYLHCDPTASHYLKVILDTIFGPENLRNEIVWKRTNAHNDAARKFPDINDTIFFYSKSPSYTFNVQRVAYSQKHVDNSYRNKDADGRRYALRDLRSPNPRPNLTYDYKGYRPHANGWSISIELMKKYDEAGLLYFPNKPDGRIRLKVYLDEMPGVPVSNLWDDIPPIQAQAAERLGYPTQKPVALLERILSASSNPGDVVLDPFCGCGTTIAAAQKLGRKWVGIDITHLSIALQKYRLKDSFTLEAGRDYDVIGEPVDVDAAQQLAQENRYQFQWWALSLIQARPIGGEAGSKKGKKGADQGIDGAVNFFDDATLRVKRVLVQVKSGHVSSRDIRDLRGVLDREGAPIGVFITLEPPSAPMVVEAASAGYYQSPGWRREFPRLQMFTIKDLLDGRKPDLPNNVTYAKAPKEQAQAEQFQKHLFEMDTE